MVQAELSEEMRVSVTVCPKNVHLSLAVSRICVSAIVDAVASSTGEDPSSIDLYVRQSQNSPPTKADDDILHFYYDSFERSLRTELLDSVICNEAAHVKEPAVGCGVTGTDSTPQFPSLLVIFRLRGGKGGFRKQLEKKGRLYSRAKRRGETERGTRGLGRDLSGERIGTARAATAATRWKGARSTRINPASSGGAQEDADGSQADSAPGSADHQVKTAVVYITEEATQAAAEQGMLFLIDSISDASVPSTEPPSGSLP